ncbi:HTH-type transcriptional regulator CysL [Aquimixticola soesokkakensis]|uniref:HTH-type transcriptional regulator CysL n=1 Tax=Aquimixticola soesokkakensis TaxID=1519096 RepID=A0A1Y5TBZ7_9RHOB|nr:LysR family transcriptional regulator [Aquimixticola soesokkakensis]SLN60194.1 HTH-type transcriptional regulator CysL [Aquimixticola soesokkakensis]
MSIDPRHLRILLAVVRQGSFSAAAAVLNMTQPSVSMAIAQLEDRLGKQVVIRDRKGALLTPEGHILIRHASAMENILDHAMAELAAKDQQIAGPMVIGGTTGAFLALVPPVIAVLQDELDALDVTLVHLADEMIGEALRRREIDIALCSARLDALAPGLEEIPLTREPFVLVSGAGKLPPEGLNIAQAALRPWVFPRVSGETKRQLEAVFISAGVPVPANVIRCDMLATQKEILRQGNALALLPRSAVATELAAGILSSAPLMGAPPPRKLVCLKLRDSPLSPLAERFVTAACRTVAQDL